MGATPSRHLRHSLRTPKGLVVSVSCLKCQNPGDFLDQTGWLPGGGDLSLLPPAVFAGMPLLKLPGMLTQLSSRLRDVFRSNPEAMTIALQSRGMPPYFRVQPPAIPAYPPSTSAGFVGQLAQIRFTGEA